MTAAEEARPLLQDRPPSSAAAGAAVEGCCSPSTSTTPARNKDRKGTTFKGVVTTALAALAVYLVATTVSRTFIWEDSDLSVEQTMDGEGDDDSSTPKSSLDAPPAAESSSSAAAASLLSGLIPPYNGTHPTLTTTEECTAGTYSVSRDAYFSTACSLPVGEADDCRSPFPAGTTEPHIGLFAVVDLTVI